MTFVWAPEAIASLLLHPSEDVQQWAIRRALDLYPDTLCNQVVRLIPSVPSATSSFILHRLAELALPITDSGPLVELARADTEPELKALAGAILLRLGYELLPGEVESAAVNLYADIVASTERGFNRVLQAYRESDTDKESVFDGVADVCGFADLYYDLTGAEEPEGIKKRIDHFCRTWECNIPRLDQLSRPEEVLSALGQPLAGAIAEGSLPWKRGLLAELEHDRARLATLRDIAVGRVEWSTEERGFLLACVLCSWRNEACRNRLMDTCDLAGLWRALVMKPWRGIPGQALREFLLSAKPEEILTSLSDALRQPYSHASYAFSILNALDTPGRFEFFLDIFEGKKYGDIPAEEAGDALRKAGAPASEFIIEHYSRMSGLLRTLVLFVLDPLPTRQVVDFCLEHFEEYMCSSAPDGFVGCLEKIASSHFLAPLIQEWREGEVGIGRAIKLISEIHGVTDGEVERVIQDAEKRTRHPEDVLDKPISSFPLRCTNCRHTYHYELKNIYMDRHGAPIIGDVIQCKGCGSIETYEMTVYGQIRVTAELARLTTLKQARGDTDSDTIDTPLKVYDKFHMKVLGREVKSTGEAYRLIKGKIEKYPQEADLQKRMGNLLKRGGKPGLALPYYLEAIKLNPSDVESYHSVVHILIGQKRYREAIPYLERLVPLCREGKVEEGLRRQIFSALLYQVAIIEGETGHKVELFPLAKREDLSGAKESITIDMRSFDPSDPGDSEWLYHVFRYGRVPKRAMKPDLTIEATHPGGETRRAPAVSGEKIGRNDPCPCGSGKKYKKCCGR